METFIEEIPMPDASASQLDRLKFLYSASRRSQAKFSRMIGLDPSSMSRLLSGKIPITDQFINRLVVNLGISKEWFLTGTGVPFPRKDDLPGVVIPNITNVSTCEAKGAALYDIDATAGALPMDRLLASDRIVGYIDIPNIDPSLPVVRVSGDSMEPKLQNGSWMSIREIHDTSIIMWGQIYLVVLEDYRMVKYLRRHPSNPDMVILHSANPAYDDIEIPRSSICKLFLVETVINFSSIV
ncbi:MAG: hypothetical protein NC405_06425 [Odoribacter sp.]|nr:hypothetical protein [Odoribacter sp.]